MTQNINKAPIKIALGDLRHEVLGKHVFGMPLGISSLAAYTLAKVDDPKDVQFRFYTDPDKMLKEIKDWQPDVIGLANYAWNTELSSAVFRRAKKTNNKIINIAGGPNFPTDKTECHEYLLKRPEIDLYIFYEGECAFASLIQKLLAGVEPEQLRNEPQAGVMSVHLDNNSLVSGEPVPRIMNKDEIPSPYLTGLMDQWFDGNYAPVIETVRGCPYTCGYCFVGSQSYYNKLSFNSVERVKRELTYIAERIHKYTDVLLIICDSNFGLFEKDEKIARHLSKLQDEYDWPNVFDTNTAKIDNNQVYNRILRMSALLKNKMPVFTSVQSLNPETLTAIKRRNAPFDEYRRINTKMKKRGIINSTTEVIAPMPEETLESYFKGLETITNVMGVNKITPYTFMVLKGTYLSSKVCKKKYQMETKFRLLPRQFGEYDGEKFFEIEEVCVATSTLSFKDYLEIRGFSFVSSFLINNQFDIIRLHLKELRISNYDYFYEFWQTIKSDHSSLSVLYNQFIEETKNELWDSPEAIYNYFSQEENYHKLLSGELGDNLIRKYEMKLFCFECVSAFELAYEVLLKMAQGKISYDDFNQIRLSLLAAKKWVINVRDVNNIFEVKNRFTIEKTLSLSYDVAKWYTDGFDSEPLVSYKKAITYKIFYNRSNRRRIRSIFQETEKLFGGDFFFQICRILTYRDISDFWRSCIVKEIDRLITK